MTRKRYQKLMRAFMKDMLIYQEAHDLERTGYRLVKDIRPDFEVYASYEEAWDRFEHIAKMIHDEAMKLTSK